jgi:hypothetical protein
MLDLIADHSDLVKDFRVHTFEQEGMLLRFKAELTLFDDSKIFIKEFVFENGERKYAYHWVDSKGNPVCRWDNAEHWSNISTFPHHKHMEEHVFESTDITINDVLDCVRRKLEQEFEQT